MLVNANFDYIFKKKMSHFCEGKIKYQDSNSKTVEVLFNTNGHIVNGNVIDKNNNHFFKVSFTENNKTNDVLFKIPINKILDKLFITSAITYVYLNTTDDVEIEPDKITINITEADSAGDKKGACFEATMLKNLDDVEIVFEEEPNKNVFEEEPNKNVFEEEPNKNNISQNSEIINNDIQLQQSENNVEELNINNVGSRNLNNDDDNNNNDIADVDKSEEDNNGILPECCNKCITGLQNLWDKIKCW